LSRADSPGLWRKSLAAVIGQVLIKHIGEELRVKIIGKTAEEKIVALEMHDRQQIHEACMQRYVGDLNGQHLIDNSDLLEIDKAGESLVWMTGIRGEALLVAHA
jgi:hypothetical protein